MKEKRMWQTGAGLLLTFVLWTVLIQCVDVRAAGPRETKVGFAAFNTWFHDRTGVSMPLYTVTDWLGLVPILICAGFGILGLAQWIRRKRLLRVKPPQFINLRLVPAGDLWLPVFRDGSD